LRRRPMRGCLSLHRFGGRVCWGRRARHIDGGHGAMNVPILPDQELEDLIYPESDGKPMADNTIQYRHIVMVQGGLDTQFRDDPNVLVVGDLFWYPVLGHLEIVTAPDVMVAFGRPKGDRRSYRQWREENVAPQVAFEILSHNNTPQELDAEFDFYQRYGV